MKKLIIFSAFILLILAGCSLNKLGGGCQVDADCSSQTSCNEDRTMANSSQCIEGSCQPKQVDCQENETCLVDSTGARCIDKLAFLNPDLPVFSCDANTNTLKLTGTNPFDIFNGKCTADCPADYTCDALTCTCDKNPQPPVNCPAPVFTFDYAKDQLNLFTGTYDDFWDFLNDYLFNPSSFESADLINIRVHTNVDNTGVTRYFPFPDQQFNMMPPDDPMLARGAYCANEYYDADRAFDISKVWVPRPVDEYGAVCSFLGVEFDGYLTICEKDAEDWLMGYILSR